MQEMYIKNGRVLLGNELKKVNLKLRDGRIEKIVGADSENPQEASVYDAGGHYIVPGFIDVHTHGAVNIDVNAAAAEDLETLSRFYASQGATAWLASVLTDTKEQTLWCIRQYRKYREKETGGAQLLGIHLEGPFLAAEYKGAMPERLLLKGDICLIREYQEAAEGGIRYITVSPEVEGVEEIIPQLNELGIVAALGHSGADYETTLHCIGQGAKAATHTFNAMKLCHQHFPAIAGAVLESDVYCEAICDGRHLHPGMVRLLLKTKGWDRVVAMTDSIMATGLPDGHYKLGVNDVIVTDGDAKLADGTRAGSTLTLQKALQNLIQFTGEPLEKVVPLLSENPARLLNIYEQRGSIEESKLADLVVLDEQYHVVDTFVRGRKLIK